MKGASAILASALILTGAGLAQDLPAEFTTGPVIREYGPVSEVPGADSIPDDAEFRIAFDVAAPAEDGGLNLSLVSAARFFNMHGAAGVDPDNIHIALVIHGRAVRDVADVSEGASASNAPLISALIEQGVEIHVCGQSAVYHGVSRDDLLPGVHMSLSAMTAHAQLQQRGYTLNPF